MYFLITGTYQDEQDVEGLECGNFEWVVDICEGPKGE